MKYLYYIFFVVMVLLFSGCTTSPESQEFEYVTTPEIVEQSAFASTATPLNGYPVLSENLVEDGYPVPSADVVDNYPAPIIIANSKDGRSQTAIKSYELAYSVALDDFHPDAYLAAIAPSHIMLVNLGNPPVLPGWFFKFRKPDSRREFIVQVVDDNISGTTLTESAMDAGYVENPIDVSELTLDSTDVLAQFKVIGLERGIWSEALAYDLELVNLEGTNSPVWSVVDPITQEWLFSVDAITGVEVGNPYQS